MHLKKKKVKGEKKEAEKMKRKQEASFLFLLSWLYRLIVNRPGCMSIAIISWIKAWGGNDRCRKRPLFI